MANDKQDDIDKEDRRIRRYAGLMGHTHCACAGEAGDRALFAEASDLDFLVRQSAGKIEPRYYRKTGGRKLNWKRIYPTGVPVVRQPQDEGKDR